MTRKIIHCDADCFFAAIEMRDDPRLRDRPMAVGGSPQQRGVISTCNYEARRFGIHSAMASRTALRLCPDLLIVPHRIEEYRKAARVMRNIFHDYTDLVEAVSLDEAYLDVSNSTHHAGSATRIAAEIRQRIARDLGITVSAGVAPSKFVAKVASEWRKPDGLFVVTPDAQPDFVAQLPVKAIPGVGKVTANKLERLGITHCRDLALQPLDELLRQFGVFGKRLYDCARGIDEREVTPYRTRKSLSVEHTYTLDLPDIEACRKELPELFVELCQRLGAVDNSAADNSGKPEGPQLAVSARDAQSSSLARLFIKIKFADFSATSIETASQTLRLSIFQQLLDEGFKRGDRPVRLLGLGVRFALEAQHSPMVQMPLQLLSQGK